MKNIFTVENLLGVGNFQGKLEQPAAGFYRLVAEDDSLTLLLLDTMQWFPQYRIDEIMEAVETWKQGQEFTVVTTVNSPDGSMGNAVTNLAGPLIIDWQARRMRQFVMHSGLYPLQARLFQEGGVK